MPLVICYHGTKARNVPGIVRDGFRKGAYFAAHLENAIHMGGRHVFGVVFNKAELGDPPPWQFIICEVIPPDLIVHHRVYKMSPVMLNDKLQEEVLQSNLAMGQGYCDIGN